MPLPRAASLLALTLFAAPPAVAQDAPRAGDPALPEVPRQQNLASAEMVGANGQRLGTVAFVESPHGVIVQVRLSGIEPGTHGLHIHQYGVCEPPDFQTAGGHYNPTGRQHGFLSPDGPHAGDLPNVFAATDGSANADFLTDRISLGQGPLSLFPQTGTAVVLHATPDDYATNPAGASGARIACGVIQRQTRP